MQESDTRNLCDEERGVLLARRAMGLPPPPSMLDKDIELARSMASLTVDPKEEPAQEKLEFGKLDWAMPVSPPASVIATTDGEITAAAAAKLPAANPPTPPTERRSVSDELADRWEQLSARLDRVFRWRRETFEEEGEVFADFESFLKDAGMRGRHLTDEARRRMEVTYEVRRMEAPIMERGELQIEAWMEEQEALAEAYRNQEEAREKALAIQARIDAARKKRYALEGKEMGQRYCHQCKLPGVHRGRECPNMAQHKSWR